MREREGLGAAGPHIVLVVDQGCVGACAKQGSLRVGIAASCRAVLVWQVHAGVMTRGRDKAEDDETMQDDECQAGKAAVCRARLATLGWA